MTACGRTHLRANETAVRTEYLALLERKARAHDAYVWATQRMASRRQSRLGVADLSGSVWLAGYDGALMDFADLVKLAP